MTPELKPIFRLHLDRPHKILLIISMLLSAQVIDYLQKNPDMKLQSSGYALTILKGGEFGD